MEPKLLEVLNKPSVSKSNLSEWSFSAIFLLDRRSIPLMSYAMKEINELKNGMIEDKKTIIKLRLLGKNEEKDSAWKAVTEELKSYSSVLQNTCTAALAPRNIVSEVKTEKAEDDQNRNLLVFGNAEEDGESFLSNNKVYK